MMLRPALVLGVLVLAAALTATSAQTGVLGRMAGRARCTASCSRYTTRLRCTVGTAKTCCCWHNATDTSNSLQGLVGTTARNGSCVDTLIDATMLRNTNSGICEAMKCRTSSDCPNPNQFCVSQAACTKPCIKVKAADASNATAPVDVCGALPLYCQAPGVGYCANRIRVGQECRDSSECPAAGSMCYNPLDSIGGRSVCACINDNACGPGLQCGLLKPALRCFADFGKK